MEYELEGINQVQIKPRIGLTFASALRTFLRQDPDIIMVGEIRDLETAQIAIQAALTGHLVISTLHTNDTVSTLSRLNFMGVPNYLVAEAIHLIISQRLVRKICVNCKEEDKEGAETLKKMGIPVRNNLIYRGRGCIDCHQTGYLGRTAIFELLKINKDIRLSLVEGATEENIRNLCINNGIRSLKQAAIEKVFDGITTVDEMISKTMV